VASKSDQTLWCWGGNQYGQLGLGDTDDRHSPTQVGVDADWAVVDAGAYQTCGIRVDSTLWCWGRNDHGQLGLGDTEDRRVPTQVGDASDCPACQGEVSPVVHSKSA
jgi:alpha-tubulin suppressor-like RCC1 family protein